MIIFILVLIGGIVGPILISQISDWSIESEEPAFSGMTFQDIIDSGYDDLTLTVAINEKENVETFMRDKLMLVNIDTYEYCNEYSGGLYATFSVEGNDDLAYYKISCSIDENGSISGYDMNLSCSSGKSIRTMEFIPFQKEKVNAIGEYIQINNAYDLVDSNRKYMKLDEDSDDRYVYSNNGTPYIYMSESQYVDNYHFYCSLSQ